MNKITALAQKISKTQAVLKQLEAEYEELRLEALRQVELTKVGATATLVFKGRVIKAKKNRYNRYKITEGKQILDSDYMWGIHDLRFAIATGSI